MRQPAPYIMGNKAKGTLYTGVTSNLKNRMWGLGLGSLAIRTSSLTNHWEWKPPGRWVRSALPNLRSLCRIRWIPAYAGMTQYYHGEREQQPWIPAYAGMTQCYHGERAQQLWIPAYAGMTQCYHGEREQQPWIPACAGLPRHSREGGNP